MTDTHELHTGPLGLTAAEAARRLAADGPNELPTARGRSLVRLALDVMREPMLLLLVCAGAISFALAETLDAAILMFSVVLVIGIELYQERKTENALAALRDLSAPRALVVRDGERVRIPGREVVRGDLVVMSEGDRVPADALVLSAVSLAVDESTLTGESVPVRKRPAAGHERQAPLGRPGGDATPWVYSGTLVVKGHGLALVRSTATGTELGRIGVALRALAPERTRLQHDIDRLVRTMAVLGLGAALLVTVVHGLSRHHWPEALLAGIATAMSMLPEEFPVVLTVFLALGAWRLSQRNVLTRRAPVLETLGSATVLCVDKTGTLTLNRMTVRSLVVDDRTHDLGPGPLPERYRDLVESAALACPIHPFDPMDAAFRALAEQHLAGTDRDHPDWELVREYPLSERLLAVTHVWQPPTGADLVIAAKGAPEAIAQMCRFDDRRRQALIDQVEAATGQGQRVLGVARARIPRNVDLPRDPHGFTFEFVGLAALHDPVRPGVPEAVAECRRAGIRTVMLTGDYPGTALAIAREIGLEADRGCITGPQLEAMADPELTRRVTSVAVFARMVPEQKLRLVRALRDNGEVVGMTGDGVNDAPALRAADIGIAMGARGTDVARESAGLVITDDDYASIVGGVRQGRGIFDNLRKAMAFIVAVHVPIAGMAVIPVLVPHWPLVLLPVQLALLELIIDPACSIVFEAEQVDPAIMDQPPRRLGEPMFGRRILAIAFLQGASVLVAVFGVYLWAIRTGHVEAAVRSLAFSTLVVGNVALILVNRSWRLSIWRSLVERRNPALPWLLAFAAALLVALLAVPPIGAAFRLAPITPAEGALVLAAGLAGVAWFEVFKVVAARHRATGRP